VSSAAFPQSAINHLINLSSLCVCAENTTMKGLSKAEEKAQRYYQACMKEAKIEELGAQPLQELISQVCRLEFINLKM